MSSGITISKEYTYVIGSLIPTIWLLIGQSFTVGKFRKRAGIKYPQMYAEQKQVEASRDAHLFNCAQRAHQNTLEFMPIVWGTTLISGIQYPVIAAANLILWTLARVLYTRGYVTGDPAKRSSPLFILSEVTSVGLLLAGTISFGQMVYKGVTGV